MAITKKAGCILINECDRTVALVYRAKLNDYSFPKGHLEEGETFLECAVRETAEETKRKVEILKEEPIAIELYSTPVDVAVVSYFYLSKDIGPSDNASLDTHPTLWIPFEEVYDKLTYDRQKKTWNSIKDEVEKHFIQKGEPYVKQR